MAELAFVDAGSKGLLFRVLHKPRLKREMYLVTHRNHSLSPAAEAFARLIVDEMSTNVLAQLRSVTEPTVSHA